MKTLRTLCMALILVGLAGCATSDGGYASSYIDPFAPSHFAQLQPGVTTRNQAMALFGIPYISSDMAGGVAIDTWMDGDRAVGVTYQNGRFKEVMQLTNVYLSDAEKQRLGLLPTTPDDRLTPTALTYLHPGETTLEEASRILGTPSQSIIGPKTVAVWYHGTKLVSIGFRDGVMVRVLALANLPLAHSERLRLGVEQSR